MIDGRGAAEVGNGGAGKDRVSSGRIRDDEGLYALLWGAMSCSPRSSCPTLTHRNATLPPLQPSPSCPHKSMRKPEPKASAHAVKRIRVGTRSPLLSCIQSSGGGYPHSLDTPSPTAGEHPEGFLNSSSLSLLRDLSIILYAFL